MGGEGDNAAHGGFLPPEPAGPEPDLGAAPRPAASAPAGPQPSSPGHRGFAPPAEHDPDATPPPAYPPAQQQLGWSGPPPGGQPGQTQPWAYRPGHGEPDNGPAVAGLTLSITAGALLLLSIGTSTIVSVVCAGLGIHYSRKGRQRVDRGETTKHRGVAQAGFVTGMVALGLSILATLLWLLVVILYATDDGFRQDLKDELDDRDGDPPRGFETSLRLGAVALRALASIVR